MAEESDQKWRPQKGDGSAYYRKADNMGQVGCSLEE
jgi:hypothetical protein